jgi:hypothetical protein
MTSDRDTRDWVNRAQDRLAEWEARALVAEAADAAAHGVTIAEWRAQQAVAKVRAEIAEADNCARDLAARAGIPPRYLDARCDVRVTEAMAAIWTYDVGIFVLSGGVGVGKSVAAAVWMMLAPAGGVWLQAAELSRDYAYDEKRLRRLIEASRLVVDDLGAEYLDAGGRYLATLSEILETRFAHRHRTLVTTNCAPEVFRQRYGERLASRIAEDGAFVVCGGSDLRRRPST